MRSSFHAEPPRAKSSARWRLEVEGDVEFDDPMLAVPLLEELQEQINKIKAAYP
jgi:hypothetical protein